MRNINIEFAYPFGLIDPRSPESEISSVVASFVGFLFSERERGGEGSSLNSKVH